MFSNDLLFTIGWFCLCVLTWKGEKTLESAAVLRKVDKTPTRQEGYKEQGDYQTKAPSVQAQGQ